MRSRIMLFVAVGVLMPTFSATSPGAVSNSSPGAGETVTVDTSAPNPVTNWIYSTASDVTINVEKDAGISVSSPFLLGTIFASGDHWTIQNAGTISSASRTGIVLADNGTVVNQAGGIITGFVDAIAVYGSGPGEVINAGTIHGLDDLAIEFNGGDNHLTLLPGSTIIGTVHAYAGTDTLTLGGDSGSDIFNLDDVGTGKQYREFEVFTKEGGSTWTLTGSGTQDWIITDGTLVANGSMSGDVTITGGTLEGTGTVGSIQATGGTVAPGNSIGTLHVTGDVTLDAGATLDVQLHGNGSADKIDAGGSATLAKDSTIHVSFVGGEDLVDIGDQWTIVHADGGVTDLGAKLTGVFAGFNLTVAVDGNDYLLTAALASLASKVTDPTAHRVAQALDGDAASGGTGGSAGTELNDFIQTVRNMTTGQATQTLLAATPRAVGSVRTMALRTNRMFHGTLNHYLRGRRMGMPPRTAMTLNPGGPGGVVGGLDAADAGMGLQLASANDPRMLAAVLDQARDETSDQGRTASSSAEHEGWGGFANAYSVFDDGESRSDVLGASTNTYAGQFGLDHTVGEDWLVGLSFTYAHSKLDFANGWGDGEVNSYRIGPYASFDHGPWFADASLTYAFARNDLTRRSPGTGDEYTGKYSSHNLAAYVGGGYDLDLPGRWKLTPGASLQYSRTWTGGYDESGPGGALSVDNHVFDSLRSTLGVSVSRIFEMSGMKFMPQVDLGWAHHYLNNDQALTARFIGGTTPFTVAVAGQDDDSIYYGAGLTALLNPNAALSLRYQGESSSHEQTQMIVASLRLDF